MIPITYPIYSLRYFPFGFNYLNLQRINCPQLPKLISKFYAIIPIPILCYNNLLFCYNTTSTLFNAVIETNPSRPPTVLSVKSIIVIGRLSLLPKTASRNG